MELLIIRHAVAEDRERFASRNPDDGQRPLTSKGIQRMREANRGLARLVPRLDYIAGSPLVRARQTTDLVAEHYPKAERVTLPELAPGGDRNALIERLASHHARDRVALVGHEPDLSELIALLCCGSEFSFLRLKKRGAVLLHIVGHPAAAAAEMQWAVTPKQLRALG